MRLRFVRLHKPSPPLRELALTFRREPALGDQKLALHFLIGLNGTGKTRFLQALAEVFLALECDHVPPPFPVWLAYDRRIDGLLRTVYLRYPHQKGSPLALVVFESVLPDDTDWDQLATIDPAHGQYPYPVRTLIQDNLPGTGTIEAFLPSPLLIYTSGFTTEWEALFAPRLTVESAALSGLTVDDERPKGWNVARENENRRMAEVVSDGTMLLPASQEELAGQLVRPQLSLFVPSDQLPLAACAVVLEQATNRPDSIQAAIPADLLDDIHWKAPIAVSLRIAFRPIEWGREREGQLSDLLNLASAVNRDPEPGDGRQLVFDLERPTPDGVKFRNPRVLVGAPTVQSLLEILGVSDRNPYLVFRTLREWRLAGLLLDLTLAFRKTTDTDVMLFDWLSDGERMFLGRMALFHLLRRENDALIVLDEPETHFNDAWKRNLVDIVEQALKDTDNHVLLTSHSSLTVTDAFPDEVILFTPAGPRRPIRTLGADQGELLKSLFGESEGVGRRAQHLIEAALAKGDKEGLEALLKKVGPGNYRFSIVEKLHDVSPDQPH